MGKRPSTAMRSTLQMTASLDRKSTRLNSSHLVISYAVFCLKKNTDQIECVAHAVGGRRARRHGAVVGPLRSLAHRHKGRSDVGLVHRPEEGRHPTRPLLQQA